jgi:hypothetical protein
MKTLNIDDIMKMRDVLDNYAIKPPIRILTKDGEIFVDSNTSITSLREWLKSKIKNET